MGGIMTSVPEIVAALQKKGISLAARHGKLVCRGQRDAYTPDLKVLVMAHKEVLLASFEAAAERQALPPPAWDEARATEALQARCAGHFPPPGPPLPRGARPSAVGDRGRL